MTDDDRLLVAATRLTQRLGLLASIWLSLMAITPAFACVESRGTKLVFLANRPAEASGDAVVLRVRVPTGADDRSPIPADILDPAGGDRVIDRISIKVDPDDAEPCYVYNVGVVGRPAYVMGIYERVGDGPTYFHAYWLIERRSSIFREPRDWRSYIVDPTVKAQAEAQRP